MTDTPHAAEPKPIVLAFSDGRRYTVKTDVARWIWSEVARGRYSGLQEVIDRALDALFETTRPR